MHRNRLVLPICIVLGVGCLLSLPLLLLGFPPHTIDGAIHAKWAQNAAAQFWNGSFYPRYFPELNNDFGSPSFFYYPPLSTLAAVIAWPATPDHGSAWYALGWSAALGLVLSGVTMLLFLHHYTGSRWSSSFGALLYMSAPYHLGVDLLDRGANAECWAFVFMPLVLLSFRHLSAGTQYDALTNRVSSKGFACFTNFTQIPTILAALSLAALFICHILTAVTFAPVALGYALFLGRAVFRRALIAGIWSLLLSSVYLLPALTYWEYVSGNNDPLFRGAEIRTTFFFPGLRISEPTLWNDPYHHRLSVIFAALLVIQISCILTLVSRTAWTGERRNMLCLAAMMQFCIIMMLPISEPLYDLVPGLQRLQFAWRFLSPATFVSTCMLAVMMTSATRSLLERTALGVTMAAALASSFYVNYAQYRTNLNPGVGAWGTEFPEIDLNGVDAFGEYVPEGCSIESANRIFRNTPDLGPSSVVLLSGDGRINVYWRTPRHIILNIESQKDLRLLLHQFWFPGWRIAGSGSGELASLRRHTDSGLMEVSISSGGRSVELQLSRLWPETVGLVVSLKSTTLLASIMFFRVLVRKRNKNSEPPA